MKNLLFIVLLSTFGMSEAVNTTQGKSTKVCQTYIDYAKAFESEMGTDEVSKQMLEFHKDKVKVHCGTLVAKAKFKKESFVELMMKSNVNDKEACKLSIDMASKYSKRKHQSELMVAAYKENIADKCGDLMAAHVSNFCLYDEAK